VDLTEKRRMGYRPAVIFGHRNKLTAEGPFLDLLHVFVEALDSSDTLTVIGYSFGDPHINALLTRWMNGNAARKLRVVNPSFNAIRNRFTEELARIGAARVTVLQQQTGAALLALYAGQRQAALGSLADPTTDAAAGDGAPPTSDGNDSIEPEHGASPNGGPARH